MVFVLSFLIMLLIVAGMAVGAMAGRGPLKGSCGGLAAVGIEGRCDICGDDPSLCEEQDKPFNAAGAAQSDNDAGVRTEFYNAGK